MKVIKSNFNINRFNFAIPLMATAGIVALGVGFINYNPEDFASASNTSSLTSTISYDDEYITISNSSVIDLGTASVSSDASYVYATDNVTVSTNVATGYDLYLSTTGDSADLTTSSSYTTIPTTSGTGGDSGTPKVLDKNTYGYAVPSGKIGNTSFDADYTSPNNDTSVWAGVPAGSSDRIRSTHSANTSGDTTDVHYGAKLTNALAPGVYTGKVVYSAVATPTSGSTTMSVSPSEGSKVGGTALIITSGPNTIDTDAELAASEVEIYFRQSGVTKGTCTVTNVDVNGGNVVTTCTSPALDTGTYDVVVVIPRFGFTDMVASSYTTVPCVSGCTIHYDPNNGTGLMGDQTTIDGDSNGFTTTITASNANTVTLHAQNFYRTDYGFAGWTTDPNGASAIYGPMETIDITSLVDSNDEVTLYAKWIPSAGNIQNFTTSTCSSMSTGEVTARKDSRDSETYAIAKLGDGRCWMIENLRLGGTSAISITKSNSVTAGTVQASSSSWSTGSNYHTTMQQNNSNTTATSVAPTNPDAAYYGYGNYYSWAQAIMSTDYYGTQNQKISTSLCPKNWHLPSGKTADTDTVSNNEFYALGYYANGGSNVTNNSAAFRKYPYNFVYSGYHDTSATARGASGNYWTSTTYSGSYAYYTVFSIAYFDPGARSGYGLMNKYRGHAVRCLIGN